MDQHTLIVSLGSVDRVIWLAFAQSCLFGIVAAKTRFCLLGGIRDWLHKGNTGRLCAYFLAITVAIMLALLLEWLNIFTLDHTIPPYRAPSLMWLANIGGGLLFGIGMTLCGGCTMRNMVLLGSGNMKSAIALLIMAVVVYLAAGPNLLGAGLFESWLQPVIDNTSLQLQNYAIPTQDIGMLSSSFVRSGNAIQWRMVMGGLFGLGMLLLLSPALRGDWNNIIGGMVVGASIIIAFYLSSIFSDSDFAIGVALGSGSDSSNIDTTVQSYSFITQLASSLNWLQHGNLKMIHYGVVLITGVIVGGCLYALLTRNFSFKWFDSVQEFCYYLFGAVLLGIGGILGMGCSIGQGIAGVSTLAIGSILTLTGIFVGVVVGVRPKSCK